MKKTFALILVALIVVPLIAVAQTASTSTSTEPSVQISGSVLQDSVLPGQTISLVITFTNNGGAPAKGLLYEIGTSGALSGGSIGYVSLGSLGAGSSQSVTIPLTVAEDAYLGTHPINVKIQYYDGRQYTAQTTVGVEVESRTLLYLREITYDTEKIEPGSTVTLTAKIQNVGEGPIKRATAQFTSPSEYITPVLAGGEAYKPIIVQNDYGEFIFQISIDSSAETQTYSATLELNYDDEQGNPNTETFTIGLPISGTPNLQVLNSEIEDGEFQVELGNLGTAKAKAIRAELVQKGEVVDVDIDNELKADKHTTMRYDIFSPGVAELHMTYVDDDGVSYESTTSLSVEGVIAGGISGSAIVLLVIVLAEAGYIFKLRKERAKLLSE